MAFSSLGSKNGAVYAGSTSFLDMALGTFQKYPNLNYYIEPAFIPTDKYNGTLSLVASNATSPDYSMLISLVKSSLNNATSTDGRSPLDLVPLDTQQVFVSSVDDINKALYCGYKQARCNGTSEINMYTNAYDFGSTDPATGVYSMTFWFNATGRYVGNGQQPTQLSRVQGAINAGTNAFLRWALGDQYLARMVGLMEMPKDSTNLTLDIASLVGTLFYTWLLQLLLPVMLATLVKEKEGRLRTMMKMHGLGDTAYWAIQYLWYFAINFIYTWILIGIGSAINLSFFTRTSYSFQFVFYFLWVSVLVAFTFLLSTLFSSARTAVVVSFLYVFGSGLVGYLLLQSFIAAGDWWAIFFDLIPGFGLYSALYIIAQYAFRAAYSNTQGITWSNLTEPNNNLVAVMIIFAVEAVVFMVIAWYLEQVLPSGIGVPKHPLFFFGKKYSSEVADAKAKRRNQKGRKNVAQVEAAEVDGHRDGAMDGKGETSLGMEPVDVAAERHRVEGFSNASPSGGHASSENSIVIKNLHKVFPGRMKKIAVRDLTMAVSRGECFGLLGPNGAGKSTTLNILTGFLTPTTGTAFVQGHDIRSDMDQVYGCMGVCPQDNLVWEQLTAREHLLFYGRLKNLHGKELSNAVETALRSVNLWNGGVADKQVKAFSGGMKRRLSVAISLMGDPLVVYLDEPSTGLDPASRQNLWNVIKTAKKGRGIILTTHSMEEAAVLCDRLGIFVDGQLVCIGAPKELTARYGKYYVLTVTTPAEEGDKVDVLVAELSPAARLTYSLAGTRRYELPSDSVGLGAIFERMERATAVGSAAYGSTPELNVLDWGVANATLEEVFVKFAKELGLRGGN